MLRRCVAGLTLMLLSQLSLGAAFAPCVGAPSRAQGSHDALGGGVAVAREGAAHAHHMAPHGPDAQGAGVATTPADTPGDAPMPADNAHCAMAMACLLVLVRSEAPRGLAPVPTLGRPDVALLKAPVSFAALLDPPPPKV